MKHSVVVDIIGDDDFHRIAGLDSQKDVFLKALERSCRVLAMSKGIQLLHFLTPEVSPYPEGLVDKTTDIDIAIEAFLEAFNTYTQDTEDAELHADTSRSQSKPQRKKRKRRRKRTRAASGSSKAKAAQAPAAP